MRRIIASAVAVLAFATLSFAASACDYHNHATSASTSDSAGQTAQTQPGTSEN